MKRILLVVLALLVVVFSGDWSVNFLKNGGFERFLDSHPNPHNSRITYYFAMALNLAGREHRASYWFQKTFKNYPESGYAPFAWAEYIDLLEETGMRNEIEPESKKFLERYPEHPKAEIIRRKMFLLKNAY